MRAFDLHKIKEEKVYNVNITEKGLMYVLIANFINLGFNLITNFVLPKELSVESYATIKTFQLYVSYAGLFHFGFVDGMYLKYGGKTLKNSGVKI